MTNRRVNALEFVLIPRINDIISYIKDELDEIDREDFVRLKKTQDNKKKKKILEEAEAAKRKGQGKEDAEAVDSDEQEVLPQQRADFEQEESSDDEVFVWSRVDIDSISTLGWFEHELYLHLL